MAHLTCVTHGKRSIVLGTNPNTVVVRHRTNHDSMCESGLLTTNGRIVTPMEVFESRYESGVTQWIADRDYHAAVSKAITVLTEEAPVDRYIHTMDELKAKLDGKWKNRPLKRVGRRGK